MGRDPETRGKLFMRHWYQAGWGTYHFLMRKGKPEWRAALEAAAEQVGTAAIEAGFPDILNNSQAAERATKTKWWGKGTFKDVATNLGAADEYDWVYAQLSDYAHSGSRTFQRFVKHLSAEALQMLYRPRKSDDSLIPWSITRWLCDICEATDGAYDLGMTEKIRAARATGDRLLGE
jgi:Family of unknown function (DUF5677)